MIILLFMCSAADDLKSNCMSAAEIVKEATNRLTNVNLKMSSKMGKLLQQRFIWIIQNLKNTYM
jgi:hypothetical protein